MIPVKLRLLVLALTGAILSACAPAPAGPEVDFTQIAADFFATLTAQAPAATQTFTPSPPATSTPTATPSPTMEVKLREKALIEGVQALMAAEDIEGAVNLCTEAVSAEPELAVGYALRGLIRLGDEEYEAAVSDFDEAIELGITADLDKEIEPGLTAKTIYYLRGCAHLSLGAYREGVEDLEGFLEVTGPSEFPAFRQDAESRLASHPLGPEPVSSGQRFDSPFFSIPAPQGQGWAIVERGLHSIQYGRTERLADQASTPGGRTLEASASAEFLDMDYPGEEFLQFACDWMSQPEGRDQALDEHCDWWAGPAEGCVRLDGRYLDHRASDAAITTPLIFESQSLACRHPDFIDVLILLQFSQLGLEGSVEGDFAQQAEAFFSELSFTRPGE